MNRKAGRAVSIAPCNAAWDRGDGDRLTWVMETVAGAVSKVLGQILAAEVPVMSAGLDSLGMFESTI